MTQWTQQQWDSYRDGTEKLARGLRNAASRACVGGSGDRCDQISYLLLTEEIQEDIEQRCHSLRWATVGTVAQLAEACAILAEELRTLRASQVGGSVNVPYLRRVPSAESIDWLHDEGLYPLMSRSMDDLDEDEDVPPSPF